MIRRDSSFSCFICSRRKDRWNSFWLCLSFVQSMELRMKERSKSVADDRMVEREFYYSYIDLCLVSYLGELSSE